MFKYLLYTLLLEMPIVTIAYRHEWKKVLTIGILLNFLTWPLLTILYNNTTIHFLLLETGVFITEAIGFKIFFTGSWQKALLVSFLANGLSLCTGIMMSDSKLF